MNFTRFQATRVWSDDLRIAVPDSCWEDCLVPPQGWVYEGGLYIEKVLPHWPEASRKRGAWYLILGNLEWITDDLVSLEQRLYDYALSEGVV